MSNFVILEGLDNAGKTTVAEKVKRHFRYHHVGPPGDGGDFPTLIKTWWEASWQERHLWDRGHLGEDVHGPTRRGTQLTDAARHVIDAILVERQATVIRMDVNPEELAAINDKDLTGDGFQLRIDEIYAEQAYLHQASWNYRYGHHIFTGPAKYVRDKTDELVWEMVAQVDEYRPIDRYGIGPRQPQLWVLGEQANPNAFCSLPFVTPSGMRMLWDALENPMIVRISNAMGPDEDENYKLQANVTKVQQRVVDDLRRRWEGIGKPDTVCLGSVASRLCESAGIHPVAVMAHPQYVWRFQHATVDEWRLRFRELTR